MTEYRADIDGLRAVAVLLVFAFHLGITSVSGGFIGVDVFFVISGFLITNLLVKETVNTGAIKLGNFYERRFRRLAPALIFTVFTTLSVGFLILSPTDLADVASSVVFVLTGTSNYYFYFGTDYWNAEEVRPLLHTWSLGVEEQFYLFWPTLILLWSSFFGTKRLHFLILLVIAISFIFNLTGEDNPTALYFQTHYRIFELGIGGLLSVALINNRIKRLGSSAWGILGVAMILYSAVTLTEDSIFPSYNAIIPIVGTLLLLSGKSTTLINRVLSTRGFVWVGLRSYSLYLIHWPLIVFAEYLYFGELSHELTVLVAILSVCFSDLMYRFVEQPFRSKGRCMAGWSPAAVAIPFISISLVLCLLAGILTATNGYPLRLGSERLAMIERLQEASEGEFDVLGKVPNGHSICGGGNCFRPNDLGRVDLALLGRSHAQHYTNGLITEGYSFAYYHLNCPSFGLNFCHNDKWASVEARDKKEQILKRIKREGQPYVVLSEVMRYSYFGGIKDPETGETKQWSKKQEWLDFVKEGLVTLRNYFEGQQLVLIGQTPERGKMMDALSCVTRPFMPDDCFASSIEDRKFGFETNLELAKLTKEIGVIFFNPHDVLCDEKGCDNFRDSKPLYTDSHHFSDYASRLLVKELAKLLKIREFEYRDENFYPTKVEILESQDSITFEVLPRADRYNYAFYLRDRAQNRLSTRWYTDDNSLTVTKVDNPSDSYLVQYFIVKKDEKSPGKGDHWVRSGHSALVETSDKVIY